MYLSDGMNYCSDINFSIQDQPYGHDSAMQMRKATRKSEDSKPNSVSQLNIALCNQVHVVVADFFACGSPGILLRIRRRWGQYTTHASDTTTTPSATRPWF